MTLSCFAISIRIRPSGRYIGNKECDFHNGDRMIGNQMLADFPITIKGRDFNAKLVIIPLMPQDLILGRDWMIGQGALIDFN